ncbi:extracellular solute-binding protein [Afipia sp. 1NLS2]|uniref:ABC transporter substrate-binding protein n=1 Tax=Afipia sp. 1NLS2 TaxID=666684 RepID=UPI0001D9E1C9|nr:extracellular solute-binding protein [Afipia sp. 1NLS2]EFI51337.1 extracellular solute-binding protein family 1 [Afipia sp. 1NLS2]
MKGHGSSRSNSKDDLVGVDRRNFLKASAGLATGIAGSLAAPHVHAKSNVTLRFLNTETSAASQAVLRDAGNAYESKFGVKVLVDSSPISGAYSKTMAALNAGVPYDISTQGYAFEILQYARAGYIVPLTDIVKKYSWGRKGDWSYQGEHWFYPYDYNLVTVYYRKDLYKENGLKVPTTWNEFLENCRALTITKGGNIERGGCVLPLASDSSTNWASFGGLFAEQPKFYDDKWNVVLDEAENKNRTSRFLDFYADLYTTMPPGMNTVGYAELMSLFATGKTAHTVYSGRVVEALEARNPDLANKYGIFAFPDSAGKQKALSFAFDGFIVFKTKQTEETIKFLKWFVDEYYINWLHSAWMNFQPARMDIYDDPRWKDHPMIQKHWQTMMQMKSFIDPGSTTILNAIDMCGPAMDTRPCKVFDTNIMPEMLQNRVLRNVPSSDCVKTAADRMRKIS